MSGEVPIRRNANSNRTSTEFIRQRQGRANAFFFNNLELADPEGKQLNIQRRFTTSSARTNLQIGRTTQISLTAQIQLAESNPQFAIVRNPVLVPRVASAEVAPQEGFNLLTFTNSGSADVYLCKYSTNGRILWVAKIAGTGSEDAQGCSTDNQGNIYIALSFSSNPVTIFHADGTSFKTVNNSGSNTILLVKYNSIGFAQWSARYGGTSSVGIRRLRCDESGNVYICGSHSSNPTDFRDKDDVTRVSLNATGNYIVKYNSSGTPLWASRIASNNMRGIGVDISGNSYIGGFYSSNPLQFFTGVTLAGSIIGQGAWDSYIAKYNTDGTFQWAARLGGNGTEEVSWVSTSDRFGNSYLCGYFSSPSSTIFNSTGTQFNTIAHIGTYDIMVVKYDTNGMAQWYRTIAGSVLEEGSCVICDKNANVYVSGYYESSPISVYNGDRSVFTTLSYSGGRDTCIVKYNTNGDVLWATRINGVNNDFVFGLFADDNENLYASGYSISTSLQIYSANGNLFTTLQGSGTKNESFLIKFNKDGIIQWVTRMDGNNAGDFAGQLATYESSVYVLMNSSSSILSLKSVGF